jgi:hypothetical protein
VILHLTPTAEDPVLAIHQSLADARSFASGWADRSGANRIADRIVSALRDSKCIYARTDRFKTKLAMEEFAL